MARAISAASFSASTASPAITLAALTMPFLAWPDLPCAVICQECPGVPIATVAQRACTVGTTQLTSPTSVEPIIGAPFVP